MTAAAALQNITSNTMTNSTTPSYVCGNCTTYATNSEYGTQEKPSVRLAFQIAVKNVPRSLAAEVARLHRHNVTSTTNWFGSKTLKYQGSTNIEVDAKTIAEIVKHKAIVLHDGDANIPTWRVPTNALLCLPGVAEYIKGEYNTILTDLEIKTNENARWSRQHQSCDYNEWVGNIPYFHNYHGCWDIELVWDNDTKASMLSAMKERQTKQVMENLIVLGEISQDIMVEEQKLLKLKSQAMRVRKNSKQERKYFAEIGGSEQHLYDLVESKTRATLRACRARNAANAPFEIFGEQFSHNTEGDA